MPEPRDSVLFPSVMANCLMLPERLDPHLPANALSAALLAEDATIEPNGRVSLPCPGWLPIRIEGQIVGGHEAMLLARGTLPSGAVTVGVLLALVAVAVTSAFVFPPAGVVVFFGGAYGVHRVLQGSVSGYLGRLGADLFESDSVGPPVLPSIAVLVHWPRWAFAPSRRFQVDPEGITVDGERWTWAEVHGVVAQDDTVAVLSPHGQPLASVRLRGDVGTASHVAEVLDSMRTGTAVGIRLSYKTPSLVVSLHSLGVFDPED
jgi:hypothetical protein